ncbi:hypothetical protein [Zavarzinella formosa]|uniref:hypothetical protein n=1 Tax=Zavarzinella formosa TaxID=360055 RepID=UPI0003188510|nr:hypothetical protein [Zavarzinella formosa]
MDLEKLKHKLLNDKQLAPVYDFFLNHGCNPEFIALGTACIHPTLKDILDKIGEQISPKESIRDLRLIRMAEEQFVHGSFTLGGQLGGIIFFEDCHTGLAAVPTMPPSVEMKYARFSLKPMTLDPSRN